MAPIRKRRLKPAKIRVLPLLFKLNTVLSAEPITRLFTDMRVEQAFEVFRTWLDDSPISRATRKRFESKGTENTLERVYFDLKEFNKAPSGTEVIIDWC